MRGIKYYIKKDDFSVYTGLHSQVTIFKKLKYLYISRKMKCIGKYYKYIVIFYLISFIFTYFCRYKTRFFLLKLKNSYSTH